MEGEEKIIYFAGGCFWGLEAGFRKFINKGILDTAVGYAGGNVENPSYDLVCSGKTGHAETVKVVYDPKKISLDNVLNLFWQMHDPTQLNRQGNDIGNQYRSAIFFTEHNQENVINSSIDKIESSGKFSKKIVTEVLPFKNFFFAEDYHQKYLEKNPSGYCHVPLNKLSINNVL